jgi:signal transduction histidine kinase
MADSRAASNDRFPAENLHSTVGEPPRLDHARCEVSPNAPRVRPTAFDDRERFAAWVAHELRTPLATQRAILELALADPAADTALWRETGENVLRACGEQEHLLEACLTLARSRVKLQRRETINLGRVVAKVVRAHDFRRVTTELQLERALTSGDPDLIERLVANFLTNAVAHNHVGGHIRVVTASIENRAVLTIENSGALIRPDEITRLFEPFQHLGPPTTASPGGLGLGLVVVKAVADAHDAVISATARAGGGLRVEVAFSAAPLPSGTLRSVSDTALGLETECPDR